jgi:hypothetical protein
MNFLELLFINHNLGGDGSIKDYWVWISNISGVDHCINALQSKPSLSYRAMEYRANLSPWPNFDRPNIRSSDFLQLD